MGAKKRAFKAAIPYTLPICAGFAFLGISYGVFMYTKGFSFLYPMIMSMTIFAGSMEFLTVNLLTTAFDPLAAFLLALMVNARHLFYGISMLDKYKGTGKKKVYLIFGMCDETFSINYTADIPADVDRSWFYFFTTLLNHFYWFSGATIGGLVGSLLKFNTDGLDFVMTAMFTVIFLEQWLKEKHHISEWIGLGASIGCLLLFGADNFLIPTMICILVALTILRKTLDQRKEVDAA